MPASTDNEIILIGGRVGDEMAELLASKANGEIGIVTFAHEGNNDDYWAAKTAQFAAFNCKIRLVETEKDLEGLQLIFYAGGDQNKLASKLKETGLHLKILNYWRKGEVIMAGSSGGAMVMCGVMLEDGGDDTYGKGSIGLTYGLAPLGACFVVPHWSEWTTPEWREEVIKAHGGGYYIWGIDENTALSWRAGHCKVIGEGKVYAVGRMKGEWGNGEEFDVARGW